MTEIVFHDGGVLMRGGLVATGNDCCCCECSFPLPEGAPEMTITGSFTLPDDPTGGACTAGTYNFSLPAIWFPYEGYYYVCHEVQLTQSTSASLSVFFFCSGGKIYSAVFLFAGDCQVFGGPAPIPYCTFCQGLVAGFGVAPDDYKLHDRAEFNGFCMPKRNQLMTYDLNCQPYSDFDGYHVEYEIEW